MSNIKLSPRERDFLDWAERIADGLIDKCVAITPRNGQHAMANRLLKRGMLVDAGWGVDANDHSRDVPLYGISDHGRAALKAVRKAGGL